MSLTIRLCERWTLRTASALVVAGAGLAGIAGCAFNLSPGEKLAASAQTEAESTAPVRQSALSRLLKKQPEEKSADEPVESTSSSTTTVGRGRLFSAIVDRFPSRAEKSVDPFLEAEIEAERHRPQIAESNERRAAPESAGSRSAIAKSPGGARTDAELWELFADDAATVVKTEVDPTLTADRSPARTFPAVAQQEPGRPAGVAPQAASRTPVAKTRAAGTNVEALPASRSESVENPFAKFLGKTESAAEPTTETVKARNVADAARQELQDLLSQAPRHDQRTAAKPARPVVQETATSSVHEQPALSGDDGTSGDAARQLERRLQASMNDPFGGGPVNPAIGAEPQGTSPFSSGSSIGSALPWTTRVRPAATPFQAERDSRTVTKPAAPAFPATPEWRGVRANSPVSLAVIERPEPAPLDDERTAVRHADIDEATASIRTPGRLLPRQLPAQDPVFTQDGRSLAFNSTAVGEGPLLAPPTAPGPILVTPAPPMAVTAAPATGALASAADEEMTRSKGYGGWIVGGILLAAGLWVFGFRSHQPARRRPVAEPK